MEERREVVETKAPVDTGQVVVDQRRSTTYDPYDQRRRAAAKLVQVIYLIFGIIEVLIAIRFVLKLLGANPVASFAAFIYGITAPLVAPFAGLFGTPTAGGMVFEAFSLVAIVIYALVAWLLTKLVWLVLDDSRSVTTTQTTDVRNRLP